MLGDNLCLHLELDDGDGFVHLCRESLGLVVQDAGSTIQLRQELRARVVLVCLHRKGGKRHQVDAIAILQGGEVGISQTQSDHIADASVVACRSTHPQDVVVTPLEVPTVIALHRVEDDMCAWTTVVDVAEDMEGVDGETLDHIGDGNDEIVGSAGRDDGIYDDIHVGSLVVVVGTLMQQLLDDVREVGRERLANFRASVFARYVSAYGYELVERDVIPVVDVWFVLLH